MKEQKGRNTLLIGAYHQHSKKGFLFCLPGYKDLKASVVPPFSFISQQIPYKGAANYEFKSCLTELPPINRNPSCKKEKKKKS